MDNTRDTTASLYESIGGAPAVSTVVDLFYAKVLADDTLAPHFQKTDLAALKAHQRTFITVALGGPAAYKGRPLREAHAQLSLKGEDFDRVVTHLAESLAQAGVPDATITEIAGHLLPLKPEVTGAA
ncbi:group 1 truncated hemoglobin [Streptomyces sp. NPDC052225]|uniref:group I truncated hemoglobin n=1 Tax=Streptomyces sp. NPDC052225 TaxID=3154949 RepID=UPI00343B9B4C